MSASIRHTSAALDARLDSGFNSIPIAWQNVKFVPQLGQMYIRPTNLRGKSKRLMINDIVQANPGIYQIDIFGPQNEGVGEVETLTDQVVDYFLQQLTLSFDNTAVYIQTVSALPLKISDAWIMSTIQVNYICYDS